MDCLIVCHCICWISIGILHWQNIWNQCIQIVFSSAYWHYISRWIGIARQLLLSVPCIVIKHKLVF